MILHISILYFYFCLVNHLYVVIKQKHERSFIRFFLLFLKIVQVLNFYFR